MRNSSVARSWQRGVPVTLITVTMLVAAGCGSVGSSGPAAEDDLADRAAGIGAAAELIYAVDLPGYEPAPQSVGVSGADGFSTAYVSSAGAVAMLTIERRAMSDADCPGVAIGGGDATEPVECEGDGEGWYRSSGDRHEYVAVVGDHVIALSADRGAADADEIRQAVLDAHPPSSGELDELFPPGEETDQAPVDRGDLPPEGDGAPINPDGTGQGG